MVHQELSDYEYGIQFHHVQLYVDNVKSTKFYKSLEDVLNRLSNKGSYDPFSGKMVFLEPKIDLPARINDGKAVWNELCAENGHVDFLEEENFVVSGQDVVEQLVVGLGWRVSGEYDGERTRSVLVTSQDSQGVKMVITSKTNSNSTKDELYDHFDSKHLDRFFEHQNGYQGIAVLGFELPEKGALYRCVEKYKTLHPALFIGVKKYVDKRQAINNHCEQQEVVLGTMTILECYAYYKNNKNGEADRGTVLRFIYRDGQYGAKSGFGNPHGVLPGLIDEHAVFDGTSIPAYSDHWVSNVTDRISFLDTLNDVLGFTPKVDFNAGVVCAGRAQIESTVTGNNTTSSTCNSDIILKDQSQVYLPINNTLTDVGHVHGFLDQIGQGVQHLASRVKDLVKFIERVNNYRRITGRGFKFLNIPPSYYGRLDVKRDIMPVVNGDESLADSTLKALVDKQLTTSGGIVNLSIEADEIRAAICGIDFFIKNENKIEELIKVVKRARYSNMYSLLKDHFQESTYMQIVRNKILVDIQANDVLFQIFTCNIIQRESDQESPFLEFIQRVCSEKKLSDGSCAPIKPGCGGFGIRNFLTLFLSIEVSKAIQEEEEGIKEGDKDKARIAGKKVELFTKQLDESNPILTEISDAMTAEGDLLEKIGILQKKIGDNSTEIQNFNELVNKQRVIKDGGNAKLQELSARYSDLFKNLK